MQEFFPKKAERLIALRIQAFAEGGAGSGDGSSGGTGVGAPVPGAQGQMAQTAKAGDDAGADAFVDYDKWWQESMADPEKKSRIDAHVKKAVDGRFGKRQAAKDAETGKILGSLALRYGVKSGDMKALSEAIEKDDRYDRERADEEGVSVETYRELQRLRGVEQAMRERTTREQEAKSYAEMKAEADRISADYPDFDLRASMKNPEFRALIDSGVSMKVAFQVLHMDGLLEKAKADGAKEAEERVTNTVKANSRRPSEGGMGGGKPVAAGVDYGSMSDKDFEALVSKVLSGRA